MITVTMIQLQVETPEELEAALKQLPALKSIAKQQGLITAPAKKKKSEVDEEAFD